jgi:ABC-type branched-subunit amino acid transport system substrate-binding protein
MREFRIARWLVALSATALIGAACQGQQDPGPQPDEPIEGTFLMAADGMTSDTFLETPESEDVFFSGPAVPESDAYSEFLGKYEDAYGEPPISSYHAHAYDSTNVLLAAIEEVGQEQGGTLTIDRAALREALYATADFQGVTGTITCDVFGDCADPNIKVFFNGEEQEDLSDLHKNVVFEYAEAEDPLGTADAEAPDYSAGAEGETVEYGPGEPVQIGVSQTISGETASLGTDQVRGIEIAVEDAGGEILGHPIELLVEDDLCAADGGTTVGEKFAANAQIVGVIGTSCSGAAVPEAQILSEAGMVLISGSNTSPFLTSLGGEQGSDWQPGYLRLAHNDQIQGTAAATYAFEELGITNAATIHDGDPYTQGLAEAFGTAWEDLGGTVALATAINKGDTDMKPVLTEVLNAGANIIYFPIFEPEGNFVADQTRDIFPTILTEPV